MRSLGAALRFLSLCAGALSLCAGVARGATPPGAASSEDDAKAAAHAHFDKGLAASNDQRFGDAARQFELAYEVWPDFRVLYNIGKVRVTLGRYVEAVDAFEAYLDQGGDAVSEVRKAEVRGAIDAQLPHIARLAIRVSDDGAELRVDGRLVGRAPLAAPLRVAEGTHTVEALLAGRPVELRELDLTGATTTELALTFPPPRAPVVTASPARQLPAPPREAPHGARTVGALVAGAGLVAAVTGAVLAYQGATSANGARARLVDAATPPPPGAPDVVKYDAAKRDFDDAKTRNQLGWALVGAGGVALVGGAALAFLWHGAPTQTSADGVATSLVVSPGSLELRGSW